MTEYYQKINTTKRIPSLPQITEFYHSTATDTSYLSLGSIRQPHNHCIFHYTIRGHGETFCGNTHYVTSPGVGFLNIVNDPESGYGYPADQTEPWEFLVICFSDGNSRELVHDMINTYGRLYTVPQNNSLISRFTDHSIINEKQLSSATSNHLLFCKLMNLLIDSHESPTTDTDHKLIVAIEQLVATKICQYLTVSEIADTLQFSQEHLTRVFKKNVGITIKAYIIEQQIAYIKHLLLTTKMTTQDIADAMNFSSSSNLIHFFRQNTGMSTKQFRALHNKLNL